MPGLVGLIALNRTALADEDRSRVGDMTKRLVRRDMACVDHGCSSLVASMVQKPKFGNAFITCEDGLVVGLCGEIYNCVNSSVSPTEFIRQGYRKRGVASFADLNGSFVVFLHDPHEHVTILANDRLGTKPLVYWQDSDLLWFSPELKVFSVLPRFPNRLDYNAFASILVSDNPFDGRSLLREVPYLPIASYVMVRDGKVTTGKYWDYSFSYSEDRGYDWYAGQLRRLLLQAVERRVPSGQTVAVFLSGGYDSKAILGCCRELGKKVVAVSYGVRRPRVSDTAIARDIARKLDVEYHFFPYRAAEACRHVEVSVEPFDGMHSWMIEYPIFDPISRVAEFALLGDQVFGRLSTGDLTDENVILQNNNIRPFDADGTWRRILAPDAYETCRREYAAMIEAVSGRCLYSDPVDRMNYIYLTDFLPRNLGVARYFLSDFIDVRSPLLDNDIVDFTTTLPVKYRVSKSLFKQVINAMFPEIAAFPNAKTFGQLSESERGFQMAQRIDPLLADFERHPLPIDGVFDADGSRNYLRNARDRLGGWKTKLKATSPFIWAINQVRAIQPDHPHSFPTGPSTIMVIERLIALRHILGTKMNTLP